jgi:hypothetical protein
MFWFGGWGENGGEGFARVEAIAPLFAAAIAPSSQYRIPPKPNLPITQRDRALTKQNPPITQRDRLLPKPTTMGDRTSGGYG